MPLRIACPSCRSVVQCPDQFLGRNVRCANCQQVFAAVDPGKDVAMDVIPLPGQPARPAPPPRTSVPPAPRPTSAAQPASNNNSTVIWIVAGVAGLALFMCCGGVGIFAWLRFSALMTPQRQPPLVVERSGPLARPVDVPPPPPVEPVKEPVDPRFVRLAGEKGTRSPIVALAFPKNGQTLLAADNDGTVIFWNPTTAERKKSVKVTVAGELTSLASADDGKTVALSSDRGTILLLNADSDATRVIDSNPNSITSYCVGLSPDGRTLATGHGTNIIKIWDVASGQMRFTLTGHENQMLAVAFAPDGKTLASAAADRKVKLWDTAARKELATLGEHKTPPAPWDGYREWKWTVKSLAFSPDGTSLASASNDGTVLLWDVTKRQARATLTMSEPVLSVAISPNGQLVASSSANGEVVIWNLASGQKRASLRPKTERGFDKAVRAVAFSPDGGKLAVARGSDIELWDLAQLPEQ